MLILKIIEAWLFINIDIFNDLVILSLVTVSCTLLQIYLTKTRYNIDKQRLFTLCRVFSVAFYFLISQPTIQNSCFSIIICLILKNVWLLPSDPEVFVICI